MRDSSGANPHHCMPLSHSLIVSLLLQWHRDSVVVFCLSLDDVVGLGLGKLSVNILFKFQRCLLERERDHSLPSVSNSHRVSLCVSLGTQ